MTFKKTGFAAVALLLALPSAICFPAEYSGQRSAPFSFHNSLDVCENSEPANALIVDYTDVLAACYDIDGDGSLNRTELTLLV